MISRIVVVLGVLTALCSAYVVLICVHSPSLCPVPHRAQVTVINDCTEQIDPGFFTAVNYDGGVTGGFVLQSHESAVVELPVGWHGRIWPRTGCDDEGICETGTCRVGINCTDPAPAGPTLAQFNIGP